MSQRARILFVDDEVAVLDGIRDLLRADRGRWDMSFAVGGEAALAELAKQPFEIIVSDTRMPGMDGAELLARVKKQHPGVTRLVLTGHAERETVLRSIPVAHQFLTKPCERSVLRGTLERIHNLHSLLANDAIRAVVGNLEKLPSVPRTYFELTSAAADPMSGVAELVAIVERDPAMTAKLLQLASSAYFGASKHISSIQQAVSFLGSELLKGLALSANVFQLLERQPSATFSLEAAQEHAIRVAGLARQFAPAAHADEAFTAALVHDIGKIIIAVAMPREQAEIADEARRSGRPTHVVEDERLGVTHAEVGAYLLGIWGVPFAVVEAVAFHHQPSYAGDGSCDVLAAVHAADALGGGDGPLDEIFIHRAGLAPKLSDWRRLALK